MTEPCRHEPQVRRAAAENQWTEALREHVAGCADCAAAAAAAPFMRRFGQIDERQKKLPDPNVVWLKAQLLTATVAAERASRPMNLMQLIAYAVVACGWAAVLTWKWADLRHWILGFTPSNMIHTVSQSATLSATFLLTVVMLATMTVILALHTILAED